MPVKDSTVDVPLLVVDGEAWLARLGSGTFYELALEGEVPEAPDPSVLRFTWTVLQPADAVQVFTWTVLEVTVVGGEQRFRWRVFKGDPGQGFTWNVIPAELLELFASQGAGAAAGIAPDTLLPIGRATKD